MTDQDDPAQKPPAAGFRETSWFLEGRRKSELHERVATTGEELPEDVRPLDERYDSSAPAFSPEEASTLSLRTGGTASHGVLPPPKRSFWQRDSVGALRAIVRTPLGRFMRGLTFFFVAAAGLALAMVAVVYLKPGLLPAVRRLLP